jgi:hypothetical protein
MPTLQLVILVIPSSSVAVGASDLATEHAAGSAEGVVPENAETQQGKACFLGRMPLCSLFEGYIVTLIELNTNCSKAVTILRFAFK